jgi:site-specific DNA recombinase
MVETLRATRPSASIILVEKTDRLYRNNQDGVTIADLGVDVHLVKEGTVLSDDS